MNKSRKNWQRAMTLVCTTAMVSSLLAACGNSENGGASSSASPGPSDAAKPKEAVKIDVMLPLYIPEAPKADNAVMKKVEELGHAKVDVTWVPSAAYAAKFNATLASGELPKALLALDPKQLTVINGARSGMFWEIGPLLKNYPNLSKLNQVVLDNTSIDGKVYGIYRERTLGRGGIIFRKDWLANLNLKTPTTIDELYNVMRAFTFDDPDKNGKQDTLGAVGNTNRMLNELVMYFGAPNKWEVKDGKLNPDFMTKEYMDALKFIKKLYDEKIINQDFAAPSIVSHDMIQQGKAGMLYGVIDDVGSRFPDLQKLNPKAELDVLNRIKGPKGDRQMASPGHSGMFLFPKSSVKTEAELKDLLGFFDKLAGKEGQDLYTWGLEGVHYKQENGKPVRTNQAAFEADVLPVTHLQTSGKDLALKGERAPLLEKMDKLQSDSASIAVGDPSLALLSQTNTERGAELGKLIGDANIKFVMGAIDEAGYKAEVDKWVKGGGDKIIAEFTAEYAKIKK